MLLLLGHPVVVSHVETDHYKLIGELVKPASICGTAVCCCSAVNYAAIWQLVWSIKIKLYIHIFLPFRQWRSRNESAMILHYCQAWKLMCEHMITDALPLYKKPVCGCC